MGCIQPHRPNFISGVATNKIFSANENFCFFSFHRFLSFAFNISLFPAGSGEWTICHPLSSPPNGWA